ncbi:serine hydrolase [Lentilactobacillus sp. SPB1-3]|uniref:Serine hydrolase n=1 Tax=Lentilactobacillus terminaliae TaxID=3003483 RepID=A0ACD5DHE6_9LACO|nr:serine hydrolase [Lentilactobacillus sp. SPB1-3]MCZ0977032.1 class A beta-lactamase-related serine hydrolase [Lentilactobacillus sp. SPB1-3]
MKIPVKQIETMINQFDGKTGCVISVNDEIGYSFRADESFKSASLIKLAVLNALVDQQVPFDNLVPIDDQDFVGGSGVISLLQPSEMTVRGLLNMMISVSDNTATNILIAYLGGLESVNQWLRDHGFVKTSLNRLMMDQEAIKSGHDNVISAKEALKLLQMALSRSSEITDWFVDQQFRYKLPGNFDELGLPITVANKTGEGKSLDHDAARFMFGDQVIDIVLLTSDFSNRSDSIQLFNQIGELIAQTILNK